MNSVGRDVNPCDFLAKKDFVLHNSTDMGASCMKMMGPNFRGSRSHFGLL